MIESDRPQRVGHESDSNIPVDVWSDGKERTVLDDDGLKGTTIGHANATTSHTDRTVNASNERVSMT
jgi:hypothetical protein